MSPDHPHNVMILLRAWLQRDDPDDTVAAMRRLGITGVDALTDTLVAATGMIAGLATLHAVDTDRDVPAVLDDLELLVMAAIDPELR